ncbi:N-ethylmaleimide reductase [compost metagenome]
MKDDLTPLFTDYHLGEIKLKNRIIMAPMTRSRALNGHADSETVLYYSQRSSAGLIISEGLPISREGTGYLYTPGIYLDSHIQSWKLVTQAVHDNGGKIFAQLWHVGRVSHRSLQKDNTVPVSSVAVRGGTAFAFDGNGNAEIVPASTPKMLSRNEICRLVNDYRKAAKNAIQAGFDGVEIHAANGYLIEQFINPILNTRSDAFGGSTLQNRTRFLLEIVDAIVNEIGADRIGIRLSPWNQLQDMSVYDDINQTYSYIAQELNHRCIAYVHLTAQKSMKFNDFLNKFRDLYQGTLILAGGLSDQQASLLISNSLINLAAFGSPFIRKANK